MIDILKFKYKQGNYLITAPHTIYLKRINDIHLPESNIRNIIKKLDNNKQFYFSTLTWNIKSNVNNISFNDPNYMPVDKLNNNIWFEKLTCIKNNYKPSFLIDIHGMRDDHNYDIIFGIQPLKNSLNNNDFNIFYNLLYSNFSYFAKKYNLKIGYNILFTGYISDDIYTISQQAIRIGIPAIQIEFSNNFRRKLVKDDLIFNEFFNTLNTFLNCVNVIFTAFQRCKY